MTRVLAIDPGAATPYYDHGLCRALAEAGCRVELVTAPFLYAPLPQPQGYQRCFGFSKFLSGRRARGLLRAPMVRRALKAAAYPMNWWRLWRRLKSDHARPEIIHLLWSVDPLFDGWWLRRLRRLGIPCVYTVHNATAHPGEPTRRRGWRRLYDSPDVLIALSESVAQQLVDDYGIPNDRIRVIPMGCDPTTEMPPQRQARLQLDMPVDSPVALFLGLIKPYKGVDLLIRAFAEVRRRVPDARLVIAGLPKMPLGPLDDLIHDLNLNEAMVRDLRYVPVRDVDLYLAAADTVVLPYRSASQSGILALAYRAGRPVVASAVGGLPEMIKADRNGLLVPPGDVAALSEAVVSLLADRRRARNMGAYGRALIEERYAWPAIAAKTRNAYGSLCGQSKEAGSDPPR